MIIATIGHTKLKLESLEDADALLNIAARATPVQYLYGTDSCVKYFVYEGGLTIEIDIIYGEKLLGPEEVEAIRAKKSEKPHLEVA